MLSRQRAASASISSRLSVAATSEEVAEVVVDALRREYACDPSVFAVDGAGWIRLSVGAIPEQVLTWHAPATLLARTPATEVRRTRQPLFISGVGLWETGAPVREPDTRVATGSTGSTALYPLLADDVVIGTLVIVVQHAQVLDRAAHAFLKRAADSCAAALQRIQAESRAAVRVQGLETGVMAGRVRAQQMVFDLVEHAPFGIYVVGADYRIVSMNRRAQAGAFRNIRPIIGRDFAETMRILWPEAVAADIVDRFRRTLETGEPYASKKFVNPRADIGLFEAYEWELRRLPLPAGEYGVVCYYFDSTPLRAIEHSLRSSHEQLALLSDAVPALIFYLDHDQRYTSVNRTFERWFGVERDDIIGQSAREFEGDEAWLTVGPQLARAYRGETVVYESDVAYRFGGMRSVHVVYTPHRAADGHVLGVVGHITDVSSRKRIEDALVRSEANERERATLLQTVLDTSPIPIWMTLDTACDRIVGNAAGDQLLHQESTPAPVTGAGPPAGEHPWGAVGQWLRDGQLVPEDMLPMQRAAREGRTMAPSDYELLRADGSRQRMLIQASPLILGGECGGAVAVAVDITDRTRVEQQMKSDLRAMSLMQELGNVCTRPGNDRGACLTQALDAAIAMTHASKGYCLLLEPASGRLTRAAQQGFDRTFAEEFDAVLGVDEASACSVALRERRRVVVSDLAGSAEQVQSPVYQMLLASGIRGMQCTPLVASHGRVLGVISTHFTEPWHPDERVLQVLDLLARQVADYLERIEADVALRDADRRKDEFLATLSHELRNPLVPLRTGVQLLRTTRAGSEELGRITEMMERQVGHMVRLVDDLLEVSRITRGSIELRLEPVDMRTIVNETVDAVRPSIAAAGHRLAVSLAPQPVPVRVDRVRLTQSLANILNNAVKYTARGGTVSVSLAQEGDEAVVRVVDTGAGIPSELLPRIFDLFTQVDRSIGRNHGGLGIGLSLARHLVAMHHGRIDARSAGEGLGSEFIVALPLATDVPQSVLEEGAHMLPVVLGAQRVLVVDDNHDAADSLAMLLQAMGADVRSAYSGEAALLEAKRWTPAVVFLDLGMPDMDGFAVAMHLRADPQTRDAALVALTGWGQRSMRQRTSDAGFDAHLVKPVGADTLAAVFESLRKAPDTVTPPGAPLEEQAPPG